MQHYFFPQTNLNGLNPIVVLCVMMYAHTTSINLLAQSLLCCWIVFVMFSSNYLLVTSTFPSTSGWYSVDHLCLIRFILIKPFIIFEVIFSPWFITISLGSPYLEQIFFFNYATTLSFVDLRYLTSTYFWHSLCKPICNSFNLIGDQLTYEIWSPFFKWFILEYGLQC